MRADVDCAVPVESRGEDSIAPPVAKDQFCLPGAINRIQIAVFRAHVDRAVRANSR